MNCAARPTTAALGAGRRRSKRDHSRQLDAQCRASSAPLRDLLDAPTALAACCGFDLCHKYILYLYLYFGARYPRGARAPLPRATRALRAARARAVPRGPGDVAGLCEKAPLWVVLRV
jgi:hypothetical protein